MKHTQGYYHPAESWQGKKLYKETFEEHESQSQC